MRQIDTIREKIENNDLRVLVAAPTRVNNVTGDFIHMNGSQEDQGTFDVTSSQVLH